MNKNNEKISKLKSINKKIDRKSTIIWGLLSIPIAADGVFTIQSMLESGIAIAKIVLAGLGFASAMGMVFGILVAKYFGNYQKNTKLIDYLNIQKEYENLEENEKDTIKELAKDQELVDAVQYISDLSFDEKRISLLKDVVLNPSIMQFVNKTDDKDCFEKITEYDFNKERLEKETEEAFENGTKPKQLVKGMKETINILSNLLRDN